MPEVGSRGAWEDVWDGTMGLWEFIIVGLECDEWEIGA